MMYSKGKNAKSAKKPMKEKNYRYGKKESLLSNGKMGSCKKK